MQITRRWTWTLPALALLPFLVTSRPPEAAKPRGLGLEVLDAATAFGRGGGYEWKSTGVPTDVMHGGEVVLAKTTAEGSYCCGYTFAVAMRVIEAEGLAKRHDLAAMKEFQKRWYGSDPDFAERQSAQAIEKLGLGREIPFEKAQAGDFVQFWRKRKKPSGHSAVFLGWLLDGRDKLGFAYISSQKSTDGIGYNVEYFAETKLDGETQSGTVDRDRTYFGRLERR